MAIEFSSFQYRNNTAWTDSIIYVALVLTKTSTYPRIVYLCEQSQLDTIFAHPNVTNAQFVSSLYRGITEVTSSQATKGKELSKLIWAPLEEYLDAGSTVYFSASGSLHQVAFAALPIGGDSLLMDRHNLVQVSSTAQVIQMRDEAQDTPESISLFGGIEYDVEPNDLLAATKDLQNKKSTSRSLPDDLTRGDKWDYLSGTLTEVQSIHKIALKNGIKPETYSGASAVEERLKSLDGPQSPDVIHIATHGFFFPDPYKERPEVFEFTGLSENTNVFRASDNPLLRSGLLFAGANSTWQGASLPDGIDDGILTAYEVSHLYLGNTKLVVLSACETALGDIKGSEGVFGLQRAFKMAGAEYIMMSLWKVPDKETAEFMTYFYESWFGGQSISDAFHETQRAMKLKYPNDPYKWAAFVLVR